jgi:hypothetical protein
MSIKSTIRQGVTFIQIALGASLVACGGGSGTSAVVAPPVVSLDISGVAATGLAISGKTVEAKCAVGSGSATSSGTGAFTISIADGVLPCVLRVTAADGSVLHSLASGAGNSATANVSPVTNLIVANLAGADPVGFYAGFNSTSAATVTTAAIASANTAVVGTLKAGGIDLTSVGNLITAALVPATATTAGNAYDKALDALKTNLASSGTTLTGLTQTVATGSASQTSPSAATGSISLPASSLLLPSAKNCPAFRSGTYRVVVPQVEASTEDVSTRLLLDAVALTATEVGSSSPPGALTEVGPCRYTTPPGGSLIVSEAGVIVLQAKLNTTFGMGVAFPEQTFTVADLAGTWNGLGMSKASGSTYAVDSVTATFGTNGVSAAGAQYCGNIKTCVTSSNTLTATSNALGGFNLTNSDPTSPVERLFAYRSGGGDLMLVMANKEGGFKFWARQRTLTLPSVGVVTSNYNINESASLVSTGAATLSTNTITSLDTVANTFFRSNINSPNTFSQPEFLTLNSPRAGYSTRRAETVTNSIGGQTNVREFVAMGLRGMGVSAVAFPSDNSIVMSVVRP